jgi:hypothetical protein
MSAEQLTEREQRCLEHLRKAAELEVTLAEYCRSFELDVKELYSAKQALGKKGLLPGKVPAAEEEKLSDFVPVHVLPTPSAEPVCRIRHPNGLLIECLSWPRAQWIAQLAGAIDVPA